MNVGDISLRELMGEVGEARRGFEEDGQHASRQRIERASMAHAMRARQVAKSTDDLEGRLTSGFVDVEDAGYKTRLVSVSLRRHRSPPWPPSAPNAPPLPSVSRSRPPPPVYGRHRVRSRRGPPHRTRHGCARYSWSTR